MLSDLIALIHDHPIKTVIVVSGCGSRAVADLLIVPNASNTILEATVPYQKKSLQQYIQHEPEKFVSELTVSKMAGKALQRASYLAPDEMQIVGLACTGTIRTKRPKRGDHHVYLMGWGTKKRVQMHLTLAKELRSREEEELLISQILILLLGYVAELAEPTWKELLIDGDILEQEEMNIEDEIKQILSSNQPRYWGINALGKQLTETPKLIVSGSFNPLHQGHLAIAQIAARFTKSEAVFELPAINADKPALSPETVAKRISQFSGLHPILVSNAPTFVMKASLYPGATFAVGYDTAIRILDPRFYDNSQIKLDAALAFIQAQGCSFFVVGRTGKDGRFYEPTELHIPTEYKELFQSLPNGHFRLDISSTELRNQEK